MVLHYSVTNQKLLALDRTASVEDSVGYLSAEFSFETDDWAGMSTSATFRNKASSTVKTVTVSDGTCIVPWEVLTSPGHVEVSLKGVSTGKTITTDIVKFYNGITLPEGTNTTAPTPTAYAQFVLDVKSNADRAEAAKADAASSASSALTYKTNAAASAAEAASDLQELKTGIASGNFKGDKGDSITVRNLQLSEVDDGYSTVTFSDGTKLRVKNGSKGSKGDAYSVQQEDLAIVARMVSVPTKVSQLENDKAYLIKTVSNLTNYYLKADTYAKSEVDYLISLIPKMDLVIANQKPYYPKEKTIYLIKNTDELTGDLYTEYLYINGKWELLGSQKLAMSGYYSKDEVDEMIESLSDRIAALEGE